LKCGFLNELRAFPSISIRYVLTSKLHWIDG
jgi:hypothetical protein